MLSGDDLKCCPEIHFAYNDSADIPSPFLVSKQLTLQPKYLMVSRLWLWASAKPPRKALQDLCELRSRLRQLIKATSLKDLLTIVSLARVFTSTRSSISYNISCGSLSSISAIWMCQKVQLLEHNDWLLLIKGSSACFPNLNLGWRLSTKAGTL